MKKIFAIVVLLPCSLLAETPAERAIAQARQTIQKNSRQPEAFNALAMALARRAREKLRCQPLCAGGRGRAHFARLGAG
jgi:hypothetical protein